VLPTVHHIKGPVAEIAGLALAALDSTHTIRGTSAAGRTSKPPMSLSSLVLLHGTVDILVLQALSAGASAHGYAVSQWVRARTEGVLAVEDAALYQALHRLEARGWIDGEWGVSENNRRAKYYSLTPAGRRQLRAEVATWKRYVDAMLKVIDPV
jgi:PadR family transcriptional regulator PadR